MRAGSRAGRRTSAAHRVDTRITGAGRDGRLHAGRANLGLIGGMGAGGCWWSQAGSNRRPLACHASALPAELWPHLLPRERGGSRIVRRVASPRGRRSSKGEPVRGARVWHISLRASSAPRRIFTGIGTRGPVAPAGSPAERAAPPRRSTSSGYLHRRRNLFLMGSAYHPDRSSFAWHSGIEREWPR